MKDLIDDIIFQWRRRWSFWLCFISSFSHLCFVLYPRSIGCINAKLSTECQSQLGMLRPSPEVDFFYLLASLSCLYQVITPSPQDLVHMEISPIKLLHQRYGHLHYRVIPTLSQLVHGIPDMELDHGGMCKGCSLGNHTRKPFHYSEYISK